MQRHDGREERQGEQRRGEGDQGERAKDLEEKGGGGGDVRTERAREAMTNEKQHRDVCVCVVAVIVFTGAVFVKDEEKMIDNRLQYMVFV